MTTTLLATNLPDTITIENDVVRSLENLEEGATVNAYGSKITQDQWMDLFELRSKKHDHHMCLECQPTWFHFAHCIECKKLLVKCGHSPYRTKTAEENAAEIAALRAVHTTEDGEVIEKAHGRQKYLQDIPEDLRDTIKEKYVTSTVQELVNEFNVAQQVLYAFLREEGVLRAKGQRVHPVEKSATAKPKYVPTGGKRGKPRTTVEVTPEMVQKAIELNANGMTWGNAAKELNANPAELNAALKATGVVMKKGKRSSSP